MKNAPWAIRAYRPEDQARLSAIWFAASSQAHAFLGVDCLNRQRQLIEETYLAAAETWVACRDGRPLGFIGLLDDFIGGLFVDPAEQGLGVGRALVAHALALKGSLQLEVYASNPGAQAFYQRLGFLEYGRQAEDGEGLPFEVVRMRSAMPTDRTIAPTG